jgi:hypothetical protein
VEQTEDLATLRLVNVYANLLSRAQLAATVPDSLELLVIIYLNQDQWISIRKNNMLLNPRLQPILDPALEMVFGRLLSLF